MQLLLTDRLACPRCGPEFGLVLLADRLEDRRVYDGVLGCPNCRDSFPVRDGFADLRAPPRGPLAEGLAGSAPAAPRSDPEGGEQGDRIVALLGIARGPGTVALVGAPARHAELLLERVPDLDVVAVDADTASWPERPRVSRMAAWPRLPFLPAGLRGVAIDGRLGSALLFEAARVTARMSRTLVVNADEGAADVLREAGLEVLAEEPGTVVAARG